MINKVMLLGRLGKEPEVRYTQDGSMVVNFSLATDESYKKDGEKVQKTEWHKIVVFGKLAEICAAYLRHVPVQDIYYHLQCFDLSFKSFNSFSKGHKKYLNKGSLVYVEGKIQTRSWEDKGTKRYITEIVASTMKMLDKKEENPEPEADTPF